MAHVLIGKGGEVAVGAGAAEQSEGVERGHFSLFPALLLVFLRYVVSDLVLFGGVDGNSKGY